MTLSSYGNTKNAIGYLDKIIGVTDNKGLFSFTAAAHINPNEQLESRCDANAFGPVCFTWTGVAPYALPYPVKSLQNLSFIKPIIDFAPDFYILYHECQESELEIIERTYDSLPDWKKQAYDEGFRPPVMFSHSNYLEESLISMWPQRHARSLGELFKLIIEWAEVSLEPFNNTEQAAVLSASILQKLSMPAEVREELIEAFPDSHVAMYIQGNENALQRPEGVPNITPLFDEWITEVILNHQYRGPIVSM
jgi:hypothetical protein